MAVQMVALRLTYRWYVSGETPRLSLDGWRGVWRVESLSIIDHVVPHGNPICYVAKTFYGVMECCLLVDI